MTNSMPNVDRPEPSNHFALKQAMQILRCYRQQVGRPLIDPALPASEQARQLYTNPQAVVSWSQAHCNYFNQQAQQVFEGDWVDLIGQPIADYKVADWTDQKLPTARAKLDSYQLRRLTKNQRIVVIETAWHWSLVDTKGQSCGQAMIFNQWHYQD